jgi:hypothetical protein
MGLFLILRRGVNYEAPHYAVLSIILSLSSPQVQVFLYVLSLCFLYVLSLCFLYVLSLCFLYVLSLCIFALRDVVERSYVINDKKQYSLLLRGINVIDT